MKPVEIISRGQLVTLDALDLEDIRSAGISWLAYCQKRLTMSHCGAIVTLAPKRPAPPTEEKYLISSQSEAEATTIREGFWSNPAGWGDFTEATRFTASERDAMQLPASAGSDAKWIAASSMESFFREQSPHAQGINQAPVSLVPVLFELVPETTEGTGAVMPFCSFACRSACGFNYLGLKKATAGIATLEDFEYDPHCEQCGGNIRQIFQQQRAHPDHATT
jgi:hypothetical protein